MVYEKLIALIAQQCAVDEDDLNEDTLFSDINADELDIGEIVLAAEGEFDISIDDSDVNDVVTIGDFINAVENIIGVGSCDDNEEDL